MYKVYVVQKIIYALSCLSRALLVSWFISVCSGKSCNQTALDVACEKEHLLPGNKPREGLVQ